jgi:hypothetical protein
VGKLVGENVRKRAGAGFAQSPSEIVDAQDDQHVEAAEGVE